MGPLINAGGSVGRVHRACFVEWDRRAEAEEMLGSLLPMDDGETERKAAA